MKKEKTVRTYQRRTKSGKMVTVREHKASYDAAEEARKAAAKKAGAGSELSKKKAAVEENPLGFSADDYKEWYHWDMEDDPKNEAALRVEKALTKKMGKKAYNKYLEDMSNSYSARGHKKAHQALLDEHTASQKKQDAEIKAAAKDISRGAKEKAAEAKTSKVSAKATKVSTASSFMDDYNDMNALREYASRVMDDITPYKAKTKKELKRMFDADQGKAGSHEETFKKFLKDEWLPNKDNVQSDRNFYLGGKESPAKKSGKPTFTKPTEKATSTESKGHPKVISRIDKLISSYQRDIEEAQKHIDAGEKGSGRLTYWREKKKNYEKAIAKLEKGREYHLSGKENQAWKALGDFVGFNKNHIISKETRTKNEVAKEKKRQKTEEQRIKAAAEAHAKDIARVAMGKTTSKTSKEKSVSKGKKGGSKKPLTSYQNHAINTLLNQPGWTMSKAEKYVRTLSDKEVQRLAHKDM